MYVCMYRQIDCIYFIYWSIFIYFTLRPGAACDADR